MEAVLCNPFYKLIQCHLKTNKVFNLPRIDWEIAPSFLLVSSNFRLNKFLTQLCALVLATTALKIQKASHVSMIFAH